MTSTTARLAIAALLAAFVAANNSQVHAAVITSNIPVTGTFGTTLSGGGTADLVSASGQFWQWVLFAHTKLNVSAGAQSVALSMNNVVANLNADGTTNLDYDNLTPGDPQVLNSANVDLNGSGGGNTPIPFTITASPLTINIQNLGNFQLMLSTSGANITDLRFDSTGSSPVGVGDTYGIPGNFSGLINGNIVGSLVNIPLIGSINLGTLFTLTNAPFSFPTAALPGVVTLTDLQGGFPPFPNDMGANFAAAIPFNVPIPLSIPLNVNQPNNNVPNGSSGFKTLFINGNLNVTLTMNNPNYNLNGQVNQVLIPEPSSIALAGFGLVGLVGLIWRRRRRA
jgi:hypothetical protein